MWNSISIFDLQCSVSETAKGTTNAPALKASLPCSSRVENRCMKSASISSQTSALVVSRSVALSVVANASERFSFEFFFPSWCSSPMFNKSDAATEESAAILNPRKTFPFSSPKNRHLFSGAIAVVSSQAGITSVTGGCSVTVSCISSSVFSNFTRSGFTCCGPSAPNLNFIAFSIN